MKVTIDGQVRSDIDYPEGQTLEQALLDINKQLLMNEKRVIAEIKVDETVPGLDMSLTPDQVTIDKVIAVSFQTQPIGAALLETMDSAETRMKSFRDNIGAIVDHLMADEIEQGMNALREGVDVMIYFFDTLHQATLSDFVNMQQFPLGDGTLDDYVNKLNETLRELMSAMNNSDFTLINDYLEYEIEPALENIIRVIPDIKARLRGE